MAGVQPSIIQGGIFTAKLMEGMVAARTDIRSIFGHFFLFSICYDSMYLSAFLLPYSENNTT